MHRRSHHNLMHEEMRMTRLTITFDDDTVDELDGLQLAELQEVVMARMDSAGTTSDQAQFFVRLSRSLQALGENPSASAVVREALDYFLAALRDAEREARLEAGYSLLAADQEREQMLDATSKRTPRRLADEP
jgi:Arc/MetJ-type ribon-helix-helix transcriptional regulator